MATTMRRGFRTKTASSSISKPRCHLPERQLWTVYTIISAGGSSTLYLVSPEIRPRRTRRPEGATNAATKRVEGRYCAPPNRTEKQNHGNTQHLLVCCCCCCMLQPRPQQLLHGPSINALDIERVKAKLLSEELLDRPEHCTDKQKHLLQKLL